MSNNLPNLANNHKDCCGCSSCEAVCPQNAISMVQDQEGFLYPKIDSGLCIGCKKCISVCSFKKDIENNTYKFQEDKLPQTYAVKHKKFDTRKRSRSGGMFSAVSDYILNNNGVVYGAILDDEHNVIHAKTETTFGRDKMRGSKYVQSNTTGCYNQVRDDLMQGREVLFTGTSCQISGLQSYLGKSYPNLYCMDIVCHGVPSPLVWKDYLHYMEEKHCGICSDVDFRNKNDFGWPAHVETISISKNNKTKKVNSRFYSQLFYTHLTLRPSCSNCPYKSVIHPGDITIADYWGIKQAAPEYFDQYGVSLVLVNNSKGNKLFQMVKKDIMYKETDLNHSMQPPLKTSFDMPENRAEFWKDYKENSFENILKKYVGSQKKIDGPLFKNRLEFMVKKFFQK